MSHRDFQELVDGHAEEFGAAAEAMTQTVLAVLENRTPVLEADALISTLITEMQQSSTQWVRSVLPAVARHATEETDSALSAQAEDDAGAQLAALELASLQLEEALHNIAQQMARDARRQIRQGLQIEIEEQLVDSRA